MNNLEKLKQELISQKSLIEELNGVVTVAGTNPSPSEITEGIKTIPPSVLNDLSLATATEEDVRQGKTFFSGNAEIKTGNALIDSGTAMHHIFMADVETITTDEPLYYTCPSNLKALRIYLFFYNYNNIHFTFNEGLTEISSFAFSHAKNMVFHNFENLSNLKKIGDSAFYECGTEGLTYEFQESLETLISYAFYNSLYNGATIKFPSSLSSMGGYVFMQTIRKTSCILNLDNYKLNALASYTFQNVGFDCDLIVPASVKTIGMSFNYNGGFHNVYVHRNVTKLDGNCFGGSANAATSNFYLKSIVFESETPPTFGTKVFATQLIDNGFKIYVPDNAVEAYKAATNMNLYVNCIYPMSEKE